MSQFTAVRIFCAFCLCSFSLNSYANPKPQWELGVAYLEGQTPHYLGSNHYRHVSFPAPYAIYRLDRLKIGDENKFNLLEGKDFLVELSFDGNLPIDSSPKDSKAPQGSEKSDAVLVRSENYTRRGMPNLPLVFFNHGHIFTQLRGDVLHFRFARQTVETFTAQ